jgi:gamma-glutamyltranspeptidase / glutathione hydrolase
MQPKQQLRRLASLILLVSIVSLARQPERSRRAMVVSQEAHATDVGLQVLRSGGNAVDAAVAIGFALAVTYPTAGNIGGGGFLLLRKADGTTTFIDFREKAPARSTRDMYIDANGNVTRDGVLGWKASAVPGTVRGLEYAHRKYGRRPWAALVQPAVELTKGFEVSWSLSRSLRNAKNLAEFPASKRIYLKNGAGFEAGERLLQPELGRVLARIAKQGGRDFYEGETARVLAEQMAANGGLITLEDLKAYQPVERPPLRGNYKGYELLTAPPPSSGGIGVLQMLHALAGSGYEKQGLGSAATTHYMAEVMRRYYADRSEWLGDPDFYKVPVQQLISPAYARARSADISLTRATVSSALKPGTQQQLESPETTHYSVVDAEGNAVAVTYTLNGGYGSGVTVPGLGMLMNNIMDDFAAKPGVPNMFGALGGDANAIQPGKRPLSAMTPTIVVKDGALYAVIGAPGGTRIITGVMQVFLHLVDFGMNAQEAVDQPRLHHQWMPDKLYTEKGFSPDTLELLRQRGHEVEPGQTSVALVQAIARRDGWWEGAVDERGNGKAAGY